MPKLALLSGANPRTIKECPVIKLSPGEWVIESDVKDTVLGVRFDAQDEHEVYMNTSFILKQSDTVQVLIKKAGTEPYITVSARKQDNGH